GQMVLGNRSEPLSQLEVLVVDCQATAAAPRGHLLEIGWAQVPNTVTHSHAWLIALPDGEHIPPAVSRITGISEHMMRAAVDRQLAWHALSDQAASLAQQPAPTVIHFARFEQPFLRTLGAGLGPLAAALLEPDEIKRFRPPYNVALTIRDRTLWFTSPDLSARSPEPSPRCPLGVFASPETLDQFVALTRGDRAALTSGPWGPDAGTFKAGYERLCATHPELSCVDLLPHAKLLRLGTRLWREGRRDRDVDEDDANDTRRGLTVWTPEFVQASLEWLALRAALGRRRAIWLTRLADSSVVWREPGDSCARLIVIEHGEVPLSAAVDASAPPPIPPGCRRL